MLRQVLNRAASHFDNAARAAIFHRSALSRDDVRTEALGHGDRLSQLADIAELYDRPEHYTDAGSFFAPPPPIDPRLSRVRRIKGGEVLDATWASGFVPHCDVIAPRYLGHLQNRTAAARLFLHDGPARPAVLLIHGYRCGQWSIEERVWPIDWLFERGLDVVIPVLPFHAVRAHRSAAALFPSSDPRMTVEGFRQSVHDLRALMDLLRDRGASAAGAMGMSLGGYTTSLLATVDPKLDFAVPMIPLASIADLARAGGRLVGDAEQQRLQFEALEGALRVVSPLARPSQIDADRVLILAAAGDRITPPTHARWLADHFGAPLTMFHGGHLLQFGRAQGFRAAGKMLGRLGLLTSR
jgi:dienelactone hydrolase